MRVHAHVNTCGLQAGQTYDLPADHPGLTGALAAGWVEDVTPQPEPAVKSSRKRQADPDPPAGAGDGGGSGEGS